MNGVDIELVVPDECQPGEVIYMDLLPEGLLHSTLQRGSPNL